VLLAMSMGGPAVTGGRDVLAVVWQGAAVVAAVTALAWALWRWWLAPPSPSSPAPASATPAERRARGEGRRLLRLAFGGLWVADGLLQARATMGPGFVPDDLRPLLPGQPAWLEAALHWSIRVWSAHPLHVDAATVLVQVGIGLAIAAGGDDLLGRAGLWLSIGWAAVVWVFGEGLGGVLQHGASFVMGVPGAALAYVLAASLLLLPTEWWWTDKAARLARAATAAFFAVGAVLQALPANGLWHGRTLAESFSGMVAQGTWPALAAPMRAMGHLALAHPVGLNMALVVTMAGLAAWLASGRAPRAAAASSICWLLAAWWLGQDFGVLGPAATDPNLALPLALVLGTSTFGSRAPAPRRLALTPDATGAPSALGTRARAFSPLVFAGLLAVVVAAVPVVGVLLGAL
jgi:hypothetical protein